jgi:hypothetical protein
VSFPIHAVQTLKGTVNRRRRRLPIPAIRPTIKIIHQFTKSTQLIKKTPKEDKTEDARIIYFLTMSPPTLPPILSLPSLSASDQLQALDTLFEPSTELHALVQPVLSAHTFSTYDQLIDAIQSQFSALAAKSTASAEKQTLYGILGSHPRLGAPSPAAQANLSELSRKEQANLNSSNNTTTDGPSAADLAAQLASLNKEYEETYPGLRYVYGLFVSCDAQAC